MQSKPSAPPVVSGRGSPTGRRNPARTHLLRISRSSAPAKLRRYVAQDRIEDVGAVVDTELVGDRQQQSIGGGDRLILGQLLDERLGFPGVGLAKACLAAVDEPDLVGVLALAAEISPV